MPTRSKSRNDTTSGRPSNADVAAYKLKLTKEMLNKRMKELREHNKKRNTLLDALDQRLDSQIQKWTDLIMRQEGNPQFEELVELVKELPKPDVVINDSTKMEDLTKSMKSLGYKAKRTAELCEETKEIQESAASEAGKMSNALKQMTLMEKKHKEMLSKWTDEKPLSEEEAKRLVMNAADKVKEKDPKLAADLKRFLETGPGTSGDGEEQSQAPSSSLSSSGNVGDSNGCHYRD